MPKREDDDWDLSPKDVEKAIKDSKTEDCLPCKAVGKRLTIANVRPWKPMDWITVEITHRVV